MNRRLFLEKAFVGASVASVTSLAACTGSKEKNNAMHKISNIGVQLYTVRDQMAKNVPQTLQKIAQIGFKEVEFAGYFNHSPADIRRMLADNGLTAPASHIMPTVFTDGDELKKQIDLANAIGHKYLIVAWLPEVMRSEAMYRRMPEAMNQTGQLCKQNGIQFAYHNHDFEFAKLSDGTIVYDMLLKNTDPNLVGFELDLFWINKAGYDPLAYFAAHKGRFPLCHVKDMMSNGDMCEVGNGKLAFGNYFAQSDLAGLKHFFVEHDNPKDSLASITTSHAHLQKLAF